LAAAVLKDDSGVRRADVLRADVDEVHFAATRAGEATPVKLGIRTAGEIFAGEVEGLLRIVVERLGGKGRG
jgi:hypothetical protein